MQDASSKQQSSKNLAGSSRHTETAVRISLYLGLIWIYVGLAFWQLSDGAFSKFNLNDDYGKKNLEFWNCLNVHVCMFWLQQLLLYFDNFHTFFFILLLSIYRNLFFFKFLQSLILKNWFAEKILVLVFFSVNWHFDGAL